ncbi:hypothetical protein ACIQB5_31665 [Streptomyces sp. NPDC088560]|uniref:hypothetical protein n=1 Tax=Streptomyces sp. NPDC088560 TaxID=3365868 RepID=UPI0038076C12
MALTAAEIADIRRYAQELADHAPPLTPEQRDRLKALLRRKPTESKPIAAEKRPPPGRCSSTRPTGASPSSTCRRPGFSLASDRAPNN